MPRHDTLTCLCLTFAVTSLVVRVQLAGERDVAVVAQKSLELSKRSLESTGISHALPSCSRPLDITRPVDTICSVEAGGRGCSAAEERDRTRWFD